MNANTHRNKSRAVALAATADATARVRFALKLAIAAALTMMALLWAQQACARSAPESFADLADSRCPPWSTSPGPRRCRSTSGSRTSTTSSAIS